MHTFALERLCLSKARLPLPHVTSSLSYAVAVGTVICDICTAGAAGHVTVGSATGDTPILRLSATETRARQITAPAANGNQVLRRPPGVARTLAGRAVD